MMETPRTVPLHPVLAIIEKARREGLQDRGVVTTRGEIELTTRDSRGLLETSCQKDHSDSRVLAGEASI
jgi:hypothetical protein